MEPVTIIIITVIIATVIFAWRTGFWKWLNYKPTPPPPPEPEPETDLDVTTNLSEEQRLLRNWLGVVVAEQRKTVKLLDRVREEPTRRCAEPPRRLTGRCRPERDLLGSPLNDT